MASTLGSLEALMRFLNDTDIPVFGVNIGEVFAKDVKRAGIMNEKKQPQYAVILAFDVKVNQEARLEADRQKVKITIVVQAVAVAATAALVAWAAALVV